MAQPGRRRQRRIAEIDPPDDDVPDTSATDIASVSLSPGRRALHGAVAGTVAAAAWLGSEPLIQWFTKLDYSEPQLLGGLVADDGRTATIGAAAHLVNGAFFGSVFGLAGGEGTGTGVAAALVENTLLWPAFVVVDRVHPKRKRGEWPQLWSDRRVIAHELAGHVVFGASLGVLQGRLNRGASGANR